MLQNNATFSFTPSESLCSVLKAKISGCTPDSSSCLTECCVGFVFNSPEAAKNGTKVKCNTIQSKSGSHFS